MARDIPVSVQIPAFKDLFKEGHAVKVHFSMRSLASENPLKPQSYFRGLSESFANVERHKFSVPDLAQFDGI